MAHLDGANRPPGSGPWSGPPQYFTAANHSLPPVVQANGGWKPQSPRPGVEHTQPTPAALHAPRQAAAYLPYVPPPPRGAHEKLLQTQSSYGTLGQARDSSHRQVLNPSPSEGKKLKTFEWESYSTPMVAFMQGGITIGSRLGLLMILMLQIVLDAYTGGKNDFFLTCEYSQVGGWGPFCEWSKAFVKGFPFIAIACAFNAIMRFVVQRTFYFRLLRAGGLMDFRNVKPWNDPVMLMLLVFFLFGFGHFILSLSLPPALSMEKVTLVVSNFVAPAGSFLGAYFLMYDIESTLLPIAKFFEERPAWARKHLYDSSFLEEDAVKVSILEIQEEWKDKNYSFNELADELMRRCGDQEEGAHKVGDKASMLSGSLSNDKSKMAQWSKLLMKQQVGAEHTHLHSTWALWIAKVMNNSRLTDKKTRDFQVVWNPFVYFFYFFMVTLVVFFFWEVYEEIVHVNNGHVSAAFAILVYSMHAMFCMWLLGSTMSVIRPLH